MRLLWLVSLLAFGLSACSPGSSDDAWVASVDGVSIRLGDLRRSLELRLEENPDQEREDVLGEELNRLISEQVILNRASQVGVEVLDADIDARLEQIHGADFADPDPEYREQVRRQMTIDRTVILDLADSVRVPESTMNLYFQEHRNRFRIPERIQVRQIVVEEREKAESIRARLKAGEDFASLATDYSLGPEASAGGRLPLFGRGEMPEAFDHAFELSVGQTSKVIESPFGFHIFKLEARHAARDPEYPEVRERIMLELEQERLEDLRRDWQRTLQRGSEIQVNERLLESLR